MQGSDSSHGTLFDPHVNLADSGGATIFNNSTHVTQTNTTDGPAIGNANGGTGNDARMVIDVHTSGVYYLDVRGVSSTGTYTVDVSKD